MPKILDDNWPDEAAVEAAWNRALSSGLNAWVTEEGMRAALIVARDTAPDAGDLLGELKHLVNAYVHLMEVGRERIIDLGGNCDPVGMMEKGDPALRSARAAIKRAAEG